MARKRGERRREKKKDVKIIEEMIGRSRAVDDRAIVIGGSED